MRRRHLLLLTLLWSGALAAPASAETFLTPYLALKFAGSTNIVDLEGAQGDAKVMYGGSFTLLTAGVLGVEGDFGFAPRFFERSPSGLVASSNVTTLMGNVVVAVPRSFSNYSLRPFVVGGVGLLHVSLSDVLGAFSLSRNVWGMNVGGGVIGPLTPRTAVRFDLRYFRNLTSGDESTTPTTLFGATQLRFWRASAGVALRY